MSEKMDFYEWIHKGQRREINKISTHLGSINLDDPEAAESIHREVAQFKEHMELHASMEEHYIHPLLARYVPGGHRDLELDHHKIRMMLTDQVEALDRAKKTSGTERKAAYLELYRSWSRYASFYYAHIDKEEEHVMPTLWKFYGGAELAATFRTILTTQKPEEIRFNLGLMIPAISNQSRFELLQGGRAVMPPEAFSEFLKAVESMLDPGDRETIRKMLDPQK